MFEFFKRKIARKIATKMSTMVNNIPNYKGWEGNDLSKYTTDGYSKSSVAFRSIDLISKSVASVNLSVYVDGEKDNEHPLNKILKKPNPLQTRGQFLQQAVAFYELTGNTYIEKTLSSKDIPLEMYCWRPDMMRVVKSKSYLPKAYVFDSAVGKRMWEIDQLTGESDLMHIKTFNPTSNTYGLSPMQAAALNVDQNVEAGKWNYSLLKKGCKPSGIMTSESEPMSDSDYKIFRKRIKEQSQGSNNAGEFMLFEGGVKWEQVGFSLDDMSWLEGVRENSRAIASVYGVPAQLIPVVGDSTYANYQEARNAFWEETAVGVLNLFVEKLNAFLSVHYKDNPVIKYDPNSIPCIFQRRMALFEGLKSVDWISPNEKRTITGFEERDQPEYNEVYINSGLLPISLDVLGNENSNEKIVDYGFLERK